jgi:hypothetical protein
MLVLDLEHAHRLTVAEVGPQVLGLALAVVRDDRVRGAEDRVRGAVVLLQRDDRRLAEVALELEDVADVGAAERVDRLVRVPHDHDVPVLFGQELEQPVLRVVRVLVLVHEDVAERLLPALLRLGEPLQDLDGQHQEVVEVDRVRAEEPPLIEVVDVGDGLVVEGLHPIPVLGRADQLVLRRRDVLVDALGREPLRVALELLQRLLHHPDLVGRVVDREVRLVAQSRRFPAQNPAAGGVEGEDPDPARDLRQEVLEAGSHLAGRLVREGDREDLVRLDPNGGDEMGHAMRQHTGLAGARAGDDEERPFGVRDRLTLGGIQVGEVGLGRGNGHAVDASDLLAAEGQAPPEHREAPEDGDRLEAATDDSAPRIALGDPPAGEPEHADEDREDEREAPGIEAEPEVVEDVAGRTGGDRLRLSRASDRARLGCEGDGGERREHQERGGLAVLHDPDRHRQDGHGAGAECDRRPGADHVELLGGELGPAAKANGAKHRETPADERDLRAEHEAKHRREADRLVSRSEEVGLTRQRQERQIREPRERKRGEGAVARTDRPRRRQLRGDLLGDPVAGAEALDVAQLEQVVARLGQDTIRRPPPHAARGEVALQLPEVAVDHAVTAWTAPENAFHSFRSRSSRARPRRVKR